MFRRTFLGTILYSGLNIFLQRLQWRSGPPPTPDEVPVLPSKISTDHHGVEMRAGESALHYIPLEPPIIIRKGDSVQVKTIWQCSENTKIKGVLYLYERD